MRRQGLAKTPSEILFASTRRDTLLSAHSKSRCSRSQERKEKAQPFLNGKSPRQFMIWISEDVIKPQFGEQYFGRIMAENVRDSQVPIIVTDGGFPEEVKPLVSDGIQVNICRLHRTGYTFDGDSRNYLNLEGYHHRIVTRDYILVHGDPMHTVDQICEDILK